jgi:effector-binding domain-containing protein
VSRVDVVAVEPRPTAVIAETTTWLAFPGLWKPLLDEVYAFVRERPDLAADSDGEPRWQNVMLYKDDTPSVEVGVLASGPFEGGGRVVASQLPGGRALMATHRGDYAQIGRAHDALHEFAAAEGIEPAGPRWEIYGHWDPDSSKIVTEVYWLLSG